MKRILVFDDVNYAASKTSATQETAASPEQLAAGAVGVYFEDPSNEGEMVLVTAAQMMIQY